MMILQYSNYKYSAFYFIFVVMDYPSKVLAKAVDEISGLPGIGRKTALRLALHLLKQPAARAANLGNSIINLVNEIKYCKDCHNFSDFEICEICSNDKRNDETICIVEDVRDVIAIENTGKYTGKYLILGGKISPMEGVGPNQLNIPSIERKLNEGSVKELIFALSATMEGDTTAYYIYKKFKNFKVNFSSIARGISVGDELEYADEISLGRSITNRLPYNEGNA
jgi:recombination protein RecR